MIATPVREHQVVTQGPVGPCGAEPQRPGTLRLSEGDLQWGFGLTEIEMQLQGPQSHKIASTLLGPAIDVTVPA